MRRHVIVSGILLILPVTDLALAAPVLVQENHQAWVDVVHIPKDTITVLGYLGKRGDEELGKLLEKVMEKPAKSSDAHALSSSAPLGPDHGSTDVVQAPGPNPASSTGNPDPLTEPPGLVSTAPMQGHDEVDGLPHALASTEHDSNHELMEAHAPQPNPKKRPLTDPDPDLPPQPKQLKLFGEVLGDQVKHVQQPDPGPLADPNFDWNYWMSLKDSPPPKPVSPKELGQIHEAQVEHAQNPKPASPKELSQIHEAEVEHAQNPNPASSTVTEGISLDDPLSLSLASPNEVGLTHQYQAEHVPQSDQGLTTRPEHAVVISPLPYLVSPEALWDEEEVLRPPSSPDPEYNSDDQSWGAGSQPVNLLSAIYAAKGKAKALRSVSSTTRDVGCWECGPEGIAADRKVA